MERCVILAVDHDLSQGSHSASQTDQKADSAEALEPDPLGGESFDLGLDKVHLDGQEDSQGPEANGPQ